MRLAISRKSLLYIYKFVNFNKFFNISGVRLCSVLTPGGRFSKDPVTYRARKAILETMIRLP